MSHVLKHSQGDGELRLRGPTSQILELDSNQTKTLAWEPRERRQMEIEIRARIIGAQVGLGLVPVVRWADELAHGDAVWVEPFPALQQIAGTPMLDHSLPARGMLFRTNAREFRIRFSNAGTLTGAPMPRCTLQVTILPCSGALSEPVYPYQHLALPAGGRVHPFPMGAREWKLTDANGQPITAGGGVLFVGVAGALFGPVLYTDLQEWTTIPHDAVGWIPDSPVYGAYR